MGSETWFEFYDYGDDHHHRMNSSRDYSHHPYGSLRLASNQYDGHGHPSRYSEYPHLRAVPKTPALTSRPRSRVDSSPPYSIPSVFLDTWNNGLDGFEHEHYYANNQRYEPVPSFSNSTTARMSQGGVFETSSACLWEEGISQPQRGRRPQEFVSVGLPRDSDFGFRFLPVRTREGVAGEMSSSPAGLQGSFVGSRTGGDSVGAGVCDGNGRFVDRYQGFGKPVSSEGFVQLVVEPVVHYDTWAGTPSDSNHVDGYVTTFPDEMPRTVPPIFSDTMFSEGNPYPESGKGVKVDESIQDDNISSRSSFIPGGAGQPREPFTNHKIPSHEQNQKRRKASTWKLWGKRLKLRGDHKHNLREPDNVDSLGEQQYETPKNILPWPSSSSKSLEGVNQQNMRSDSFASSETGIRSASPQLSNTNSWPEDPARRPSFSRTRRSCSSTSTNHHCSSCTDYCHHLDHQVEVKIAELNVLEQKARHEIIKARREQVNVRQLKRELRIKRERMEHERIQLDEDIRGMKRRKQKDERQREWWGAFEQPMEWGHYDDYHSNPSSSSAFLPDDSGSSYQMPPFGRFGNHESNEPRPTAEDSINWSDLISRYNERWETLPSSPTVSQVPWPSRTLEGSALFHLNDCGSLIREHQERLESNIDYLQKWNAFSFFVCVYGFFPSITVERTKLNPSKVNLKLSIDGHGDLEGLRRQAKKELTRWHADRLQRRGLEQLRDDEKQKAVWEAIQDLNKACREKLI